MLMNMCSSCCVDDGGSWGDSLCPQYTPTHTCDQRERAQIDITQAWLLCAAEGGGVCTQQVILFAKMRIINACVRWTTVRDERRDTHVLLNKKSESYMRAMFMTIGWLCRPHTLQTQMPFIRAYFQLVLIISF